VLTAALCTVGPVAAAAPAQVSRPATSVTGRDPLAPYADEALAAWRNYSGSGQARWGQYYDRLRDAIALEAARRVGADGAAMQAAWRAAEPSHQVALLAALTQLGTPYHRNSANPGQGFDCSGLTAWAWGQAGVSLQRQSRTQIRDAAPLTHETAQAGDLMYYPGHVMLYLGVGDAMIHAPYTGASVEVGNLNDRHTRWLRYGDPTA
jgi:cell wall-associated NlpC family hydrolase